MIRHDHQARIYFAHTDAGGVVYHAAYLALAEQARTEALRDAGFSHAEMLARHGAMFVVQRINLEYLRPGRPDDLLTIRSESVAATGATATLSQRFRRGAEEIASLVVVLACVKAGTFRPCRIPQAWASLMSAHPLSASGQ